MRIATVWDWIKGNPKMLVIIIFFLANLGQIGYVVIMAPGSEVKVGKTIIEPVDISKYKSFDDCVDANVPDAVYELCDPKGVVK